MLNRFIIIFPLKTQNNNNNTKKFLNKLIWQRWQIYPW